MKIRQNNKLYFVSFTICICVVLLVILTTGAYLTSGKNISGTISVGSFDVYLVDDPSDKTNLSGSTLTNSSGEYSVALDFDDDFSQLYVYNAGSAAAYVRISVVSASYADYITLTPLGGTGYTWYKSGNYYYLTANASGVRKTLPGNTCYNFAYSYTLSELPSAALSNKTFTFQLKLEAIQAANTDSGTHGNLIWTSGLPGNW